MKRLTVVAALLLTTVLCGVFSKQTSAQSDGNNPQEIFGIVQELRSGTADVLVCLCDAETGMPLEKDSYQPFQWEGKQAKQWNDAMAIAITDERGRFSFNNVPDGNYRVIAQRWAGPVKSFFDMESTVLQLMGAVDNIRVPRPKGYYESLVAVLPAGRGIVSFDQQVPNSDTVVFFSMSPPEFDPVLGLHAMGKQFQRDLIGVNRMPLGQTTLIGAPPKPFYAFFFAPDNSPGFSTLKIKPSATGFVRVPSEPFVAGWSDGRKTPPKKIAALIDLLNQKQLSIDDLLEIPELSAATHREYSQRFKTLYNELSREIEFAGTKTRVGDLLAAKSYLSLSRR